MLSKFFQLEEDKQTRIINAALKVFSESNYKNASTDDIIKEAGISKGSLFYYFKNKKLLYEFLIEYVTKYLHEEVMKIIDLNNSDLFTRLKQVLAYKVKIMLKYPYMLNFILKAFDLEEEQKKVDLKTIFYKNIDLSKFKDDVNLEMVMNLITWTSEGYANKILTEIKSQAINQEYLENVEHEFNQYLEVFRKMFYKGEI